MSYCRIVRAIRRFCLDCQGGAAREVRICTDLDCALRVWRMAGARVGELAMDASDARPPGHDALSASCGVAALPSPRDTMQATLPEDVPQTPCTPTGPLQTGGTEDMAAGKASFRCASPVDGAASPSLDRNGDRAGFPAECVPPGNEGEAVLPCGPSVASASIAAAFATPCAGATPARRARCGHTVSVYSPKPTAGCVAASAARVPLSCRDFP